MDLLKRWREQNAAPQSPSSGDPPRYGFSYSVYWLQVARTWDAEQRRRVAQELHLLLSRPDFVANQSERRYHLPDLEGHHSGGSLVALAHMLRALSAYEEQEGQEQAPQS